jgi:hypothetical protein
MNIEAKKIKQGGDRKSSDQTGHLIPKGRIFKEKKR